MKINKGNKGKCLFLRDVFNDTHYFRGHSVELRPIDVKGTLCGAAGNVIQTLTDDC
jgi:hypothetical protein